MCSCGEPRPSVCLTGRSGRRASADRSAGAPAAAEVVFAGHADLRSRLAAWLETVDGLGWPRLSVCLSICVQVRLGRLSGRLTVWLTGCLTGCLAGWLPVSLSVCLSICLSACLSVSVCLSACVWLSVWLAGSPSALGRDPSIWDRQSETLEGRSAGVLRMRRGPPPHAGCLPCSRDGPAAKSVMFILSGGAKERGRHLTCIRPAVSITRLLGFVGAAR